MTLLWQRAARALYALLLRVAAPLYLFKLWRRGGHEPLYRQSLGERFGRYAGPAPAPGLLWLHAVSLGETRAAAPLIEALREQQPTLRLLITHGTATGRAAGQALMRPGDHQVWLPYDTPGAARRFLLRFQPCVGVLMETELWPSLMREAERAGLPIVLANARLSERSARKGRRLAALLHPAARRLTLALAQTAPDAARLQAAGAPRVLIEGNLKFDMTPPELQLERGRQWRAALQRPVVMAANTREGEEASLLDAWCALAAPRPLLLLVPRHPQRFDEVAGLVSGRGLALARRSGWADEWLLRGSAAGDGGDALGHAVASEAVMGSAAATAAPGLADVWLGDSMGEMALYYACADVALQGGSFAPLGGHNLIEAAACGCPVVMGPQTFNFAQAAEQALAAGAALRVANMAEGVAAAVALAQDPQRPAMVQRALAFAGAHRGAARQMAQRILLLATEYRR